MDEQNNELQISQHIISEEHLKSERGWVCSECGSKPEVGEARYYVYHGTESFSDDEILCESCKAVKGY